MDENKVKLALESLQSSTAILFKEVGLTDEVLDIQTNINKIRNKYNITDETKLTEFNKGFVQ
jgi:hypothetical protein